MARHFTKEEIDEIRKQLATRSVRDTDMDEAHSVTGDDYIAIVQDGTNKKVEIQTIEDKIYTKIAYEGIDGKILSDNNYTDQDKSKLYNIASGAQVNVIEQIRQDGVVRPITNKSVNIDLSDFVHKNLVPSEASTNNKLADKAFVRHEISISGASFRGTSPTGLSYNEFIAWANSQTHDVNDYVYWSTVTIGGDPLYKRYKWNGTEWLFEYDLNNSAFTDEQQAAINSGVTSELVTKLIDMPDEEELQDEFDAKQDVIEDLEQIRQNASTGGNAYHLPSTGMPKTDMAQDVRSSLGLADTAYQIPSSGIPKDSLSSSVIASLDKADAATIELLNKVSSDDIDDIIELTQTEFNALTNKDPRTLYIVTDSTVESEHVGIAGLEQTTSSSVSDGVNVWTCTLTNGETFTLQVKNGSQGNTGSSIDYAFELLNTLDSTAIDKGVTAAKIKELSDSALRLGTVVETLS